MIVDLIVFGVEFCVSLLPIEAGGMRMVLLEMSMSVAAGRRGGHDSPPVPKKIRSSRKRSFLGRYLPSISEVREGLA